jgi:vitamin B12 transporter
LATHSIFDLTPRNGGGRITEGYYGQWQTTVFDALTLTGGLRYEHDHEFGSHTSVKLNGAYNIESTRTTIRAAYGDGFKAPSLYELFSDFSNPLTNLRPETSHGWEAGVDQTLVDGKLKLSLTYFDNRYRDLIDFFSCFGVVSPECTLRAFAGGYYYNVNRAHIEGFEGKAAFVLTDTLTATANFTSLVAKNVTAGQTLPRRPRFQANGNIDWNATEELSVGAGLTYVGNRFNDAFGFTTLSPATVVDVHAAYRLGDTWQLYGRVENLFDERAQPIGGYGRPGRAFTGGLRVTL